MIKLVVLEPIRNDGLGIPLPLYRKRRKMFDIPHVTTRKRVDSGDSKHNNPQQTEEQSTGYPPQYNEELARSFKLMGDDDQVTVHCNHGVDITFGRRRAIKAMDKWEFETEDEAVQLASSRVVNYINGLLDEKANI